MSTSIDLTPLSRQINEVGREIINNLGSQIDGVQANLGTVRNDLQLTRSELADLREEFQQFVEEAARVAAVQQSQVKIVDLKAQLDREFGHYSVVRRTSVGLLQGFDVGNISNAVATNVAEELMIQTPRYWLAPALVALAAWSHDRQDIAEKSVQEAFSRDRHKTSLFFTLVLRRQGRMSGSVRWLRHYMASLDPSALTREFAVILEASSCNAFGPEGNELLSAKLAEWSKQLRQHPEAVEEQVGRWTSELASHQLQLGSNEYQTLRHLCAQWNTIRENMEAASALPEVLAKYRQVRDHEAPPPTSLEDLLDDILDTLVTEFDAEELPLRREVTYHEAVIEERGDLNRAEKKAELLQEALEETNDVVTIQTMGAISSELLGISVNTQKMAIGVARDDFRTAVGRYCSGYRAKEGTDIVLDFNPNHSNHASAHGFVGAKVHVNSGQQAAEGLLRDAWGNTMNPKIERARFDNKYYLQPALIAAGIAVVLLVINPIAGLLAALIGAGVIWYLGEQKKKAAAQEVKALEHIRQEAYDHSVQLYRNAMAELTDANLTYKELDAFEAPLLELIDGWPTTVKEN